MASAHEHFQAIRNPSHARRSGTLGRRLKTVPPVVAGFATATPLLPVLLLVAAAVDITRIRRPARWMALRMTVIVWVYLAAETIGLLAMLSVWLFSAGWTRRGRERMIPATYTSGSGPERCGRRSPARCACASPSREPTR